MDLVLPIAALASCSLTRSGLVACACLSACLFLSVSALQPCSVPLLLIVLCCSSVPSVSSAFLSGPAVCSVRLPFLSVGAFPCFPLLCPFPLVFDCSWSARRSLSAACLCFLFAVVNNCPFEFPRGQRRSWATSLSHRVGARSAPPAPVRIRELALAIATRVRALNRFNCNFEPAAQTSI